MRRCIVFINGLLLAAYLPARAAEPSVEMQSSFTKITDDRAMTCFKHHPEGTFEAILKDEPKSRAELDIKRTTKWTISSTQDLSFISLGELKRMLTLQNMNTLFKSYTVKVEVTWELVDKIAKTTSYKKASDSMILDVKAFSVGLEAVPSGNKPELESGRICLNAQPEYKKAKWKVTVLPEGTTATVTPVSGGVIVSDGAHLTNDQTCWALGGTVTGNYTNKITHDMCNLCTATNSEKVFKFVKRDLGITGGPETPYTPFDNTDTFYCSSVSKTGGDTFESSIKLKMSKLYAPISTPVINQEVEYQYKMETAPFGCYEGKIESGLSVFVSENVLINASGVFGNNFVLLSSVKIKFTDTITISGLARGNGSCTPHLHSVQVPVNMVQFDDGISIKDDLLWMTTPVFNVNEIVTVKNTCTMEGVREGTFPLGGSGGGTSKVNGFKVDHYGIKILQE
jgi:hypothetical protein